MPAPLLKSEQSYRDDNGNDDERVIVVLTLFKVTSASMLPDRSRTNTVAKISGYGARPSRSMAAFFSKNADMWPPIRSSNVPLHASATLEVP